MLASSNSLYSQAKRYKLYDDYIENYKYIAIRHMKEYKIPASITLAQGILESGAGKGALTQKSNNHFGIKCNSDWTGAKTYHDDDNKGDCFRKYDKAEGSFADHARFLSERPRYKNLFSLDITDYRGWARGLQNAGYATDKAYANKLIKMIEDYELFLYDQEIVQGNNGYQGQTMKSSDPKNTNYASTSASRMNKHAPYKTKDRVYVIAQRGDTYEAIANEFSFKVKDLYEYNEVPEHFPLDDGDIVYFQKKKSKADKPHYEHVIKVGESMHSISQIYGIKVHDLYKMNKKDYAYIPVEGDILRLR